MPIHSQREGYERDGGGDERGTMQQQSASGKAVRKASNGDERAFAAIRQRLNPITPNWRFAQLRKRLLCLA